MADNLLSADELSALAEGVNDGTIAVDTGFNTAARVKKHDIASEDSSLGVNVGSIDMINERFIRLFRPSLMDVLRSSPRINPTKVQILKFGDYVRELKAPLSVNVIRMNPLRGYSMVVIGAVVARAHVYAHGNADHQHDLGRDVSQSQGGMGASNAVGL